MRELDTFGGYVAKLSASELTEVRQDPAVAYVEQDAVVQASDTQSPATWGLDRIDQRDLPLNNSYTYNATGSGVRAYIIDTGILTTHSQFSGRTAAGYSAINDGRGTTDCNGHGTHVAGTVGGSTYGVAKAVTLDPGARARLQRLRHQLRRHRRHGLGGQQRHPARRSPT